MLDEIANLVPQPSQQALIGIGLIGLAGVVIAWREQVAASGRRLLQ